jgi:tRNA threonylcarbamoyladenosine biosynthesis protein TsaE
MLESPQTLILANELATEQVGQRLAEGILNRNANKADSADNADKSFKLSSLVIFLEGDLAAGKTTLVRGFLRGMGHRGTVKSPTYTLVEEYQLQKETIFHFDLYRLFDAEELEFMGIREYFTDHSIVLVEWAERGLGFLPTADVLLTLKVIPEGRLLTAQFLTEKGLILQSYINQQVAS